MKKVTEFGSGCGKDLAKAVVNVTKTPEAMEVWKDAVGLLLSEFDGVLDVLNATDRSATANLLARSMMCPEQDLPSKTSEYPNGWLTPGPEISPLIKLYGLLGPVELLRLEGIGVISHQCKKPAVNVVGAVMKMDTVMLVLYAEMVSLVSLIWRNGYSYSSPGVPSITANRKLEYTRARYVTEWGRCSYSATGSYAGYVDMVVDEDTEDWELMDSARGNEDCIDMDVYDSGDDCEATETETENVEITDVSYTDSAGVSHSTNTTFDSEDAVLDWVQEIEDNIEDEY